MANIRYAFWSREVTVGKECEIFLYFDSISDADNSLMLRCRLHDPKLNLDHLLDGVLLSSMTPVSPFWGDMYVSSHKKNTPVSESHFRSLKLVFPPHFAGGKFLLCFYLERSGSNDLDPSAVLPNITELKEGLVESAGVSPSQINSANVSDNHFTADVEVKSESDPSIKSLYWGIDANISYGKESTRRTNLTAYRNETLFVHVHTEGLYGHDIVLLVGTGRTYLRVLDNVCVYQEVAPAFFDQDDAKIKCSAYVMHHSDESMQITPELSYDTRTINLSSSTYMPTNVMTEGETDESEKSSDTLSRVDFRLTPKYDGSFGFSWYRVGDTGTEGTSVVNDNSFLDTLEYHYDEHNVIHPDLNSGYRGCFDIYPTMIAGHRREYGKILMPKLKISEDFSSPEEVMHGLYLIPQLTIRKGKSAVLDLYETCNGDKPKEYKLEFSNPNAEKGGFLSVDKKSISSFPNKKTTIKVTCNKEFSRPVNLDVYAYPEKGKEEGRLLCGSIHISPNDVMHQRDIYVRLFNLRHKEVAFSSATQVSVPQSEDGNQETTQGSNEANTPAVQTQEEAPVLDGARMTNLTDENLQLFYNQAYVNVHVEKIDIELDNPQDSLVKAYKEYYHRDPFEEYKRYCKQGYPNSPNSTEKWLDMTNEGISGLVMQLKGLSTYPGYEYFSIFAVPMKAKVTNSRGGVGTLYGRSLGGQQLTMCFLECSLETPAHELGHALGLPHTFTGCTATAKYTYQYHTTDNIMDYSNHGGSSGTPVKRQSFFYWQMKSINSLME